MKTIYLLIALLCATGLFAQEPQLKKNLQGHIELSEVVVVDSFPVSQLYLNATLFLANAFNGVRETSQIKDEKAKSVATKGSFTVTIENSYGDEIKAKTFFTLIIQCKENMYRFMLNDFYFGYTEETGITSYASFNDHLGVAMNKKQWQEVELQTEEFLRNFIDDLKTEMSQKVILCKEMLAANKKKK